MLTMENIQNRLVKGCHNNKSNFDVVIEIKNYDTLYTCFCVYKWEGEEIIGSRCIYFFSNGKKNWRKNLKTCLAIMNGEVDPFEEENNEDI